MRALGGERDCQQCLAAARRPEDLVDVAGLKAGAAHGVVDGRDARARAGANCVIAGREEIHGASWFGTKFFNQVLNVAIEGAGGKIHDAHGIRLQKVSYSVNITKM